jgi:hypothetical protein
MGPPAVKASFRRRCRFVACLAMVFALAHATAEAQGPAPDPAPSGLQAAQPDPAPAAAPPAAPPPAAPRLQPVPVATAAPPQPAPAAPVATPAGTSRPAPPRATRPPAPAQPKPKPKTKERSRPEAAPTTVPQRRDVHGSTWGEIARDLPRAMTMATAAPGKTGVGAARPATDDRLVLQIGMLLIFLYLTFLAVWFAATRRLRTVGIGEALRRGLLRGRGRRGPRVEPAKPAATQMVVRVPGPMPAPASPRWTCEIAWRPEPVRLQAVMARPPGVVGRVIAETKSLPWPPKDPSRPPTRELEAAFRMLVASVEAAGWQPVRFPGGTWLERRFVWLRDGEPPSRVQLLGEVADVHTSEPPLRAPRGANRRAVLRVVAERPGVSPHELATASRVKPGSLRPLLARLIRTGVLEKQKLSDGRIGYFLADRSDEAPQPAKASELEGVA